MATTKLSDPLYTWEPLILSEVWGTRATGYRFHAPNTDVIFHAITLRPSALAMSAPDGLWRMQVEMHHQVTTDDGVQTTKPAIVAPPFHVIEDARMQFVPLTVAMAVIVDTRQGRPAHIVPLMQIGMVRMADPPGTGAHAKA